MVEVGTNRLQVLHMSPLKVCPMALQESDCLHSGQTSDKLNSDGATELGLSLLVLGLLVPLYELVRVMPRSWDSSVRGR